MKIKELWPFLLVALLFSGLIFLMKDATERKAEFMIGCKETEFYVYEANPIGWRMVYDCTGKDMQQ